MTIEVIFYFGTEIVIARVNGHNISFGSSTNGAFLATIDGLKLNRQGVEKEFPDLKGKDTWREEAIKRFKDKISAMKNEDEVVEYIVSDLKKYGYVPKYKQKSGFRAEVLK